MGLDYRRFRSTCRLVVTSLLAPRLRRAGASALAGAAASRPAAPAVTAVRQVPPAVKHDVSPALSSITQTGDFQGQHADYSAKPLPARAGNSQTAGAPAAGAAAKAPAAGLGFDGVGNGVYGYAVNSAPPDTTGA